MEKPQSKTHRGRIIGMLSLVWLLSVVGDRLWLSVDQSVPSWDAADYLNGVLTYWQACKTADWFNLGWWRQLWLLSPKTPPLTYLLAVPIVDLFGTSADAITLLFSVLNAVLLISVFGLGAILFNPAVGLWAAIFCQFMPGLYRYRLEFLLDFPLTTAVTAAFGLLTLWRQPSAVNSRTQIQSWGGAIAVGLGLGLALLVKQTALFFLLLPILWIGCGVIRQRDWGRLVQWLMALLISVGVGWPWYRTNWLLILTSGKRATVDSALREGDPTLLSFEAWAYYSKILWALMSSPLIVVSCAGLGYGLWLRWRQGRQCEQPGSAATASMSTMLSFAPHRWTSWRWLTVFVVGGYLLSSLNINKDSRYILPLLPIFAVILAAGFCAWPLRWRPYLGLGILATSLVLMGVNLFPIAPNGSLHTSAYTRHLAYLGPPWPHVQVIESLQKAAPYQRTTLGVLPSTPQINQHNFSFFGKRAQEQVSGRQVGVREADVAQDARSLDWFLTKTGDQGWVPEAQASIVNLIQQGTDFQLHQAWVLPQDDRLELYRRRQPALTVTAIAQPRQSIQLDHVMVPAQAPPGTPIPVTYHWSGPAQAMRSGLVLLTWQRLATASHPTATDSLDYWLHDRAIGMGNLHPGDLATFSDQTWHVIERTAMFPGNNIASGTYTLQASYLDPQTEQVRPINTPDVQITIAPTAPISPAPELDLSTQLRLLAPGLAQGIDGLDPIFAQIARINQYDPNQDYLRQLDRTLAYRFEHQAAAQTADSAYALVLARVLRQDIAGAIAMLERLQQLEPTNPYPFAYQAFVYLYDWRPRAAQKALQRALVMHPELPELQVLNGVADLLQGRVIPAWRQLSNALPALSEGSPSEH